jgi:hypothetical protein
MRRPLLTTTAALLATGSMLGMAHATEVGIQRPIGVGLVAGSAPGLTAKIWTRPTNAVDLGFVPSLAFDPSVLFLEGALGARVYL